MYVCIKYDTEYGRQKPEGIIVSSFVFVLLGAMGVKLAKS